MKRRHLLAAAALAAIPQSGRAQAFPERPIRFIVPYAPGGSTDTSARIVSEKLAALLGQPVIVENKPGGGTIIGTEIVAKSKPDGHTILLTPAAMIAIAAFGMAVPYDIDKDLVPVVGFVDLPILLAASNKAPFKTVAELIAWSKAEPGRTVAYASAGVGSLTHLWGEYVKAKTGLPMEHVGYKGSAEALRDVIAGHVPLFADVLVPTATAVRAGQIRGLAVAMAQRSELLPDVPTVAEAGLPGTEGTVPFGISVPGGTPASVVMKLNTAFNEALGDPPIRRKLLELGFVPVGGAPQAYVAVLANEIAKWRKVIKEFEDPAADVIVRNAKRARPLMTAMTAGLDARGPLAQLFGRPAQEAVDHAAPAGADVAAAVGGELLQDDARRHRHPAAVEQRVPHAVVVEIGAGRPAIALRRGRAAVAARVARAGLLQLLVPVVVLGMALAVLALGAWA